MAVDKDEHGSSEFQHPLFLSALPSNFESNDCLSALAAIIDEEISSSASGSEASPKAEPVEKHKGISTEVWPQRSGPMRTSSYKRKKLRFHPYTIFKDEAAKKTQDTLGEAQLYLNLWKI
eukprot:GILK01004320.1.p1 GENE.GILK01004320.1~~GILK01004320.1.p1  ORF type:complete len:130 (+),score=14.14 GILK01004320.1:32-391(+)